MTDSAIDRPSTPAVLIVGNLSVGKSTIFRKLCGATSEELNLSESSLALSQAETKGNVPVVDTPGVSTVFAQGVDEVLVRDALLTMDLAAVLVVADARNMRRSLALAEQVACFGLPMVMAVNMEDEALRLGTEVDSAALAELLGYPVVDTTAHEGRGMSSLARELSESRLPERELCRFGGETGQAIEQIKNLLANLGDKAPGVALLALTSDAGAFALIEDRVGEQALEQIQKIAADFGEPRALPPEVLLTDAFFERADALCEQVVHRRPRHRGYLERFGIWAQHPVAGVLIAISVIVAMYYWVGVLGATLVVDAINVHLFEAFLLPWCEALTAHIPSEFLRGALMDPDFGVIPTGLFLAFGLVLPVLFFFYFFFEILHGSGYLPRLSVLMDRLLRRVGLNGRGVLPIIMGFSCITMALITTRMLETRKERIIASLLLMMGIPCAPLMAMLLLILADLPLSASITVFGVIGLQILLAGTLANKILPGQSTDLVMIIPDMRVPALNDVLVLTVRRTYFFMREAVPFFLLASFVLFVADRLGALDLLEQATQPVVHGLLGLPDQAVRVFIKTMIRRENGAAELALVQGAFDNRQLVITLLVMTFLIPCVNSALVLIKERGLRSALALLVAVSVYAIFVGALVNHICHLFGVTFA